MVGGVRIRHVDLITAIATFASAVVERHLQEVQEGERFAAVGAGVYFKVGLTSNGQEVAWGGSC